jgi:hypothetical protein
MLRSVYLLDVDVGEVNQVRFLHSCLHHVDGVLSDLECSFDADTVVLDAGSLRAKKRVNTRKEVYI